MPHDDPLYATSLAHGLAVLEAFADGPAGLTNKALAQRTGLSTATVSRLTYTLASRGLVVFDASTQCHRLGSATLTLANPLLVSLGVRRLARLLMKRMSDDVAGTVSLGMRDRTRMVYVETCRGNELIDFRADVGAALPMLQSAIGRAWLAAASDAERREVLGAIRHEAPAQYRRWMPAARSARADLAARGHCVSRGDWRPDVHAVAVPLNIELDGTRLVLNCGVPTRHLASGALESKIAPRLRRLAVQIEAEWGKEAAAVAAPFPRAPAVRPPHDPSDRHFARTLARGVDLLRSFQAGEDMLGNGVIARRLGLSGPTVARLTHTLGLLGYLRRDSRSARYPGHRLGAAVLSAAYPMLSNLELREQARPAMLALAEKVGGSVSLGVRHDIGMVYIDNVWRTDGRLMPPDTGTVMPLLASAMGRAWLSRAEPAERDAVMNQIRVHDAAAWSRHAAAAPHWSRDLHRHGYCRSRDVRPDVEAFGVPLTRLVRGVRYVMNCGVLAPHPLTAPRAHAVGTALVEAVRTVESTLGDGATQPA